MDGIERSDRPFRLASSVDYIFGALALSSRHADGAQIINVTAICNFDGRSIITRLLKFDVPKSPSA